MTMMSMVVRIGGSDLAASVVVDTISVDNTINARDTASFSMMAPFSSGYRPRVGQTVGINADGAASCFAGTIEEVSTTAIQTANGDPYLSYQVRCVDWTQIFDRHLVAAAYENFSASQICASIVSGYLASEGITAASLVSDTATLERVVFNYDTAAAAMDDLCDLCGYSWYVDVDKNLHVFNREDNLAPFSITKNNCMNIRVVRSREKYRNRQYVKAGYELAASTTEWFYGDGKTQTFVTTLPVGRAPTLITVLTGTGLAASTIGIRNVDTGYQWYWKKSDNTITQAASLTPLGATQFMGVVYSGLYPILIKVENPVEISDRAAVEGGGGVYEGVSDDPNINSEDVGLQKGQGLLDRYGHIPETITFDTDTQGLRAGQIVSINLPTYSIKGQYLIESVSGKDMGGIFMRWTVKALSGESLGGWVSFFKALIRSSQKMVLRENEVVVLGIDPVDTVECSDVLTAAAATISDFVGSAIVGVSVIY